MSEEALDGRSGSAEHFILATRPGKIPTVKGPYPLAHVSKFLQELRSANRDATITVCHVVDGPRLWAISEAEWMIDESPNAAPSATSQEAKQ